MFQCWSTELFSSPGQYGGNSLCETFTVTEAWNEKDLFGSDYKRVYIAVPRNSILIHIKGSCFCFKKKKREKFIICNLDWVIYKTNIMFVN